MTRSKLSILDLDNDVVDQINDEEIEAVADELDSEDEQPEPKVDLRAKVADLARLSPLEFDQVSKDEAAALGVERSTLKAEVKKARKLATEDGADFLADAEPWPTPVNGAILLREIRDVTRLHMVMPDGAADTVALWALFTHCHDSFNISPLLAIHSPTPECGKTTLLTLLGEIVRRPLPSSNVTVAVLFRAVEKWSPTLIIDEADTFLPDSDELRGILNSGHNRRNAFVLRAVGEDFEPKQFSTWAPKAIAMIGRVPPTLYSRAVRVELKRKTATEQAEPLREDRLVRLEPLRRKAARWAQDNIDALRSADPEIPETMYSRIADNWRPLFAIADRAGEEWPDVARCIAESSVTKTADETRAVVLLADIADIFDQRNVDRLHSDDIVADLVAMEGRAWAECSHGRPITKNHLARLLKPFEIEPKQVRIGSANKNGYHREAFEEAFERYLPDRGSGNSTPLPPYETKELRVIQNSTAESPVEFQKAMNPLKPKACRAVEVQNPLVGKK